MRKLLLGLGLILAGGSTALAEAPFAPSLDASDHVVTMMQRGHGEERSRIVTSHGRWARVETTRTDNRVSHAYFARDGSVAVHVFKGGPDEHQVVSIVRGGSEGLRMDRTPFNTGERQSWLGESCTVWNVRRSLDGPLHTLSCLTDDGIELWTRTIGSSGVAWSAEAIRIERRPVAAEDAEPPRGLTMLEGWFVDAPDLVSMADFETTMERIGLPGHRMTTRRHRGWTLVDKTFGEHSRSLALSHRSHGLHLRFESDATGAKTQLLITRTPFVQPLVPLRNIFGPKDLGRGETVLGERCRWFDMTPGVMDAGESQCRTHDGIALKQEWWSRGSRSTYVAVSVARRPFGLDDIKPPAFILDRKTWGLPD